MFDLTPDPASPLRIPKAGEFWTGKFSSHGPYHVAGYDPAADRVFRMMAGSGYDLCDGWDSLARLHEGWHPPSKRYSDGDVR